MKTMRLLLCVAALSSFSCLGRLHELVKEQNREFAVKNAPPWALAARHNSELGPGGYERLLTETPKRLPQENAAIHYCLEIGDLVAVFQREAPPDTRREYLGDA